MKRPWSGHGGRDETCRWKLAGRGENRIAADRADASRRHQRDLRLERSQLPRSTTPISPFWARRSSWPARSTYTVVLDDAQQGQGDRRDRKAPGKGRQAQPAGAGCRSAATSRLTSSRCDFEQELGNVPDILARPGESWERTEVVDIGSGQTLTFPEEVRVRRHREKGRQDARQDSRHGDQGRAEAGSRRQLAAQGASRAT